MSNQRHLLRRGVRIQVVTPPDLPEIALRPMEEILKERQKRYELHRAVPPFWEEHVDRHLATDPRPLKDARDAFDYEYEHLNPLEYRERYRRTSSHLCYKLRPRLWPLVLNLCVFAFAATLLRLHPTFGDLIAFWFLYGMCAFGYAIGRDGLEKDGEGHAVPKGRWKMWFWKHGAFPPLALYWTFVEARAWLFHLRGWKKPPLNLSEDMERLQAEEATSERRKRLEDRLETIERAVTSFADRIRTVTDTIEARVRSGACLSDEEERSDRQAEATLGIEWAELAPVAEEARATWMRLLSAERAYFSAVRTHPCDDGGRHPSCPHCNDKQFQQAALKGEYLRLYRLLDEAEAMIGPAGLDGEASELASVTVNKGRR